MLITFLCIDIGSKPKRNISKEQSDEDYKREILEEYRKLLKNNYCFIKKKLENKILSEDEIQAAAEAKKEISINKLKEKFKLKQFLDYNRKSDKKWFNM